MKISLHYRILVAFILLPMVALATDRGFKGKHTKEKTIHKEYNVNADALVKINNSYGNIDITTWSENRVVIDVKITTNGNNEEKVILDYQETRLLLSELKLSSDNIEKSGLKLLAINAILRNRVINCILIALVIFFSNNLYASTNKLCYMITKIYILIYQIAFLLR